MSATFTIQLNKLRFSSGHGVFAEEAITGNEFEINLSLEVEAPEKTVTSLEETINYAEVYRITKEL
ncbi:MAG TPA: dihydroneopterin aldolase, partial [Flavisolibacter sp.]|nr:dihydroneopterin aldolase [Flavisolibacter sp.]